MVKNQNSIATGAILSIITGASAKIPNCAITQSFDVNILHNSSSLQRFLAGYRYVRLLPYLYTPAQVLERAKQANLYSDYLLLDFDTLHDCSKLQESQTTTILNDIRHNTSAYRGIIAKYSNSKRLHVIARAQVASTTQEEYRLQVKTAATKIIHTISARTGIVLQYDKQLERAGQGLRLVNSDIIAVAGGYILNDDECKRIQEQAQEQAQERQAQIDSYSISIKGKFGDGKPYEPQKGQNYDITAHIVNAVVYYTKQDEKMSENVLKCVFGAYYKQLEIYDKLKSALKRKLTAYYCRVGLKWLKSHEWYVVTGVQARESQATHITLTDDYISSVSTQIDEYIRQHQITQIVAPVGVGKTTYIRNYIQREHEQGRTCLILNFLNILNNDYRREKKVIVYEGAGSRRALNEHNAKKYSAVANIATIGGITHILNDFDTIIIDEVHKLFLDAVYRQEHCTSLHALLEHIKTTQQRVITFTGTAINSDLLINTLHIHKGQKRVQDNFYIDFVKGLSQSNLCKYIPRLIERNERAQIVVLINNSKRCLSYAQQLEQQAGIKCDYITRPGDTESKRYLIEHKRLKEDVRVFFCTSIINEGLNINNTDSEVYYITDVHNIKNPANVVQLGGRSRMQSKKIIVGYNTDSNFDISIQATSKQLIEIAHNIESYEDVEKERYMCAIKTENERLNFYMQFSDLETWRGYIDTYTDSSAHVRELSIDDLVNYRDDTIKIQRDKPSEDDLKTIYKQLQLYSDIKIKQTTYFDIEGKSICYNDPSIIKKLQKIIADGYHITGHYYTFSRIYSEFSNAQDTAYKKGKTIVQGKKLEQLTARQTAIAKRYARTWEALLHGYKDNDTLLRAMQEDEQEQQARAKKQIEQARANKKTEVTFYYDGKEYVFVNKTDAIEKEFFKVIGVSKREFLSDFKRYKKTLKPR